MLVLQENQKLYLSSWNYNKARILTEMAKMIKGKGGKVKTLNNAIIINRTIEEAKNEELETIERLKKKIKENIFASGAIEEAKKRLLELEKFNNNPIKVSHTSYINFTLNNYYYYYQIDENIFFDFFYTKQEIKDNKIIKNVYLDSEEKKWLKDCYLSYKCNDEEIKEAAKNILNMLENSNVSKIYREKTRKRVYNYNRSGYHYETTYSPILYKEIDF